jgi:hypothetical protein
MHLNRCILIALAWFTSSCPAPLQAAPAPDTGYTYSCWLNGWRKTPQDKSADRFGIETSHYGFTIDVDDFSKATFGRFAKRLSYAQALTQRPARLRTLPAATLALEVVYNDETYRATTCAAGLAKDNRRLSAVRLWESGRCVQHYDFLGLDFRNADGEALPFQSRLILVAWARNLSLSVELTAPKSEPGKPANTTIKGAAKVHLSLKTKAKTHKRETNLGGNWTPGTARSTALHIDLFAPGEPRHLPAPDSFQLTVTSNTHQPCTVAYSPTKRCYVATAPRLKRKWKANWTDIRNYDEFTITTTPAPNAKGHIPFLLDFRNPANITGLCPILCDAAGRPTGIPVQLSKNWHYPKMGAYLMAYTQLPNVKATYRLRIPYGFYGTLPSASHSQLSLIGYGGGKGNGRWDQLAIGCWGETICFDVDMSLTDVAITDVRALMIRDGLKGRQWGWTDAGWGGDWLMISTGKTPRKTFLPREVKTAYLAHGPCLTDVRHDGYYGPQKDVAYSAKVQTLRTDDFCRTFQTFTYTFTRDVTATNVSLFKLGRTFYAVIPTLAYGNAKGLLKQIPVPNTLRRGQHALRNQTLSGPGPWWVCFPDGYVPPQPNRKKLPDGTRGIIIRNYTAVLGGKTYRQPTISAPVLRTNPKPLAPNLDLELVPPAGIKTFRKGDTISMDIEMITLPRTAADYYGPNEAFRAHLAAHPRSWKTTYREAAGNDLKVNVTGGTLRNSYPILIDATGETVQVSIQGGVGFVPICFRGLPSPAGYTLCEQVGGKRIPLNQAVHGNDFWQTDYDAATKRYTLTFNLPLDGKKSSTWILTKTAS